MSFIAMTDDTGQRIFVAAHYILSIKPRPRTELGTVVRFSNGTSVNVQDSTLDLVNKLTSPTRECDEGGGCLG